MALERTMCHVDCDCGTQLKVRLSQAGSDVQCTGCRATLTVPDSSELKRLAGDQTPCLDSLQRIAKAVEEGESPFHGVCHRCAERPASIEVPVAFDFLVRREVSERDGIQLGITSSGLGLSLVAGAATECWRKIEFPLMFCTECHKEFNRQWQISLFFTFIKRSIAALLLLPVLLLLLVFGLFVPLVSVAAIVLVIIMVVRYRTRKNVDPFLLATLQKLPLVTEAISAEDEFQVSVDRPRAFAARGAK